MKKLAVKSVGLPGDDARALEALDAPLSAVQVRALDQLELCEWKKRKVIKQNVRGATLRNLESKGLVRSRPTFAQLHRGTGGWEWRLTCAGLAALRISERLQHHGV